MGPQSLECCSDPWLHLHLNEGLEVCKSPLPNCRGLMVSEPPGALGAGASPQQRQGLNEGCAGRGPSLHLLVHWGSAALRQADCSSLSMGLGRPRPPPLHFALQRGHVQLRSDLGRSLHRSGRRHSHLEPIGIRFRIMCVKSPAHSRDFPNSTQYSSELPLSCERVALGGLLFGSGSQGSQALR